MAFAVPTSITLAVVLRSAQLGLLTLSASGLAAGTAMARPPQEDIDRVLASTRYFECASIFNNLPNRQEQAVGMFEAGLAELQIALEDTEPSRFVEDGKYYLKTQSLQDAFLYISEQNVTRASDAAEVLVGWIGSEMDELATRLHELGLKIGEKRFIDYDEVYGKLLQLSNCENKLATRSER